MFKQQNKPKSFIIQRLHKTLLFLLVGGKKGHNAQWKLGNGVTGGEKQPESLISANSSMLALATYTCDHAPRLAI